MLYFKIVDPSGDLKDGQIYDSNRSTILAALKDQGFCASDMGIARDRLVVCVHVVQWNSTIEATIGEGNLAFIEGCPYFRGNFELRKILQDVLVWPF